MIFLGKYMIIDNLITACDYEFVLSKIQKAIKQKKKLLISPIASHTLVRAHYDNNLKKILDNFDYLLPDSQWIRWSIPFLYGKEKSLDDRVYGPDLMLKMCKLAEKMNYRVFLYGNTESVLMKLEQELLHMYQSIKIVGKEASKFRELRDKELYSLRKKITASQTNIIFVSLGSPKQEIFSYKLSKLYNKSLVIIPIGAAFDFISKNKLQAPKNIQKAGLEWLYRLLSEPKRLLTRYFFYGVLFLFFILFQKMANFNYTK